MPVTHVDWTPPAGGDAELAGLSSPASQATQAIEAANREAVRRILAGEPVLVDVMPALEAIPALAEGRIILHAGPPIEWARMCGPMQGAICGAIVFEGWAPDLAAAEKLAAGGGVTFHPNHHFDAVGPMTGLTTRSMPVMVVENRKFGNRAYCAINEGLGKVMRFGGNDAEVLARLAWLRDVLGPALGKALRARNGVPLKPLIARGLSMGDEMHQRNVGCTGLFLREIAPWLARTSDDSARLAEALAFIAGNDQFFLNIAMALGKAMTDPARNIARSTIVTAMCRNGTDFGIRVSGTGDHVVHRAGRDAGRPLLRGLLRRRRQSRHGRLGDRRDHRAGRLRHGGGAGGGRLRRRRVGRRCRRLHADHARDHRRPRTRNGPSRRSTSPASPPASTCASWSRPASRPPSTPASRTGSRASARSAPAWCARRWRASRRPRARWPRRRGHA